VLEAAQNQIILVVVVSEGVQIARPPPCPSLQQEYPSLRISALKSYLRYSAQCASCQGHAELEGTIHINHASYILSES
jgi:hypothetical protein